MMIKLLLYLLKEFYLFVKGVSGTISVNKKSRFIKEQEASKIWCSLGLRTPLIESPLVGSIWFKGF